MRVGAPLRSRPRLAVDRRALSVGLLAMTATTLATGVVATIVDRTADLGPRSNWTFLLGLVVLAGWVAGGVVAGTVGRSAPVTHALVAATVVWGGWQIVAALRDASGGWATVAVNGLLAVGAGLLGGVIAGRRRR